MRKIGKKWSEIARLLGGRTENAVKNRFQAVCKRDFIDPNSEQPSPTNNDYLEDKADESPGGSTSQDKMKKMIKGI